MEQAGRAGETSRQHPPPLSAKTPRLNANQLAYGCTIEGGVVFCRSPGTGMGWKPGHDPNKGQKADAYDCGGAWDCGDPALRKDPLCPWQHHDVRKANRTPQEREGWNWDRVNHRWLSAE